MVSVGLMAAGYILLFLSNTLSSSAGVGGGLLNVAIIHSVQGYDLKSAVVLSLSAIMGNTLVQLIINIRTRHPTCKKRSVIYWDVIAIMLPAELGGSNLGVILSAILPPTLLYIGAILVLMMGGVFSVKKGLHLYELENERAMKKLTGDDHGITSNPISSSNEQSRASADSTASGPSTRSITDGGRNTATDPRPRFPSFDTYLPEKVRVGSFSGVGVVDRSEDSIADPNAPPPPMEVPWFLIGVVTCVWMCYLVLYIVMALVPGCSSSWGITLAFIYIILLIEVPWGFNFLTKQQRAAPESIVPGDIRWAPDTYAIPLVTFSIGMLTALLGFGGGELIGPYLLHLRIQPLVSTATSGMISFLNTTLSLIHYAILGKVHYDTSGVLFVLGMVAGFCGRMCSLFVVARFDRASILVCALCAVLGLSWVVYIVYIATGKVSFDVEQLC
jgi:uncharacterized membrane protein YfcA